MVQMVKIHSSTNTTSLVQQKHRGFIRVRPSINVNYESYLNRDSKVDLHYCMKHVMCASVQLITTYYTGRKTGNNSKKISIANFHSRRSQCRDLNVTIFKVQKFGGDKFYSAQI